MAQISIIGTLGKDPKLEHGQNGGKAYTRLSLAWSESAKDQGGHWVDGPTVWLQVTAFGRVAENVVRSLHKGDRVVVTGRVKPETWTNRQSGESSTVLTVVADVRQCAGGEESEGWSAVGWLVWWGSAAGRRELRRSVPAEVGRVELGAAVGWFPGRRAGAAFLTR
jgi:single-strand DNA-binding protein